jgi:hypothetical protein
MPISANTFSNFGTGVFFANEASVVLLGCESRLYNAEPARTQFKNAIDDLFNLFGRVLWRFHIEPNAAGGGRPVRLAVKLSLDGRSS